MYFALDSGTVIKYHEGFGDDGGRIDNTSCHYEPLDYSSALSELAGLVPFSDYINPTRVGLVPTYINQAV